MRWKREIVRMSVKDDMRAIETVESRLLPCRWRERKVLTLLDERSSIPRVSSFLPRNG